MNYIMKKFKSHKDVCLLSKGVIITIENEEK